MEQEANPALRGKPIAVVVGGHRTVITPSSYEALARGSARGVEQLASCSSYNFKQFSTKSQRVSLYLATLSYLARRTAPQALLGDDACGVEVVDGDDAEAQAAGAYSEPFVQATP